MKNKYFLSLSILVSTVFFSGCESKTFGIDEAVWSTLNEKERMKIIEGYNERKAIALLNDQIQKELELENTRQQHIRDAQTAPIYAMRDVIASICNQGKDKPLRIQSIASDCGAKILTIGDEQFEISWTTQVSPAWVKGQAVSLTLKREELAFPVTIKNLDNGEKLQARKIKH